MGVNWNMGTIGLEFYEGNIDCQKFESILKIIYLKLRRYFQKLILQWYNYSNHKSNDSLKFYITN